MKLWNTFLATAGVSALLWSGHVFTVGGNALTVVVACAITVVWTVLFIIAYNKAYR